MQERRSPAIGGTTELRYGSCGGALRSGVGEAAPYRPCGDLGAGGEAELGQDVLHVRFDRALREHELLCDLTVRPASGNETSDLDLAARQSARWLVDNRQSCSTAW